MLNIVTKFSYWVGIVASVFSLSAFAVMPSRQPLTLNHAVSIALAGNPGLAKLMARAHALAEIPAQQASLPDPVLSLNAINVPTDTFSRSQESMTQMQLGIMFALPFPGKLDLRAQAAEFEASAAKFDIGEMRLILVSNVRSSWWRLFYLDRALSIVQRNQLLLRQLIKIAETKYKTGQGIQSDVLLAQVELSKLLETRIRFKEARQMQAAVMDALLDRPTMTRVNIPTQANEILPSALDLCRLQRIAENNRPILASRLSMLDAAHSRVSLAKKDYYPDFKLGGVYGMRSGKNINGSARSNLTSIALSMNLPIFTDTKQDSAVAQRQAEVMKEKFSLADSKVRVGREVALALAAYQAGKEQTLLFKTGIIPQARQMNASMFASYQVSKVDFLNLVRAQITLYNYETQYWKALSSSWQAWARLEAAVGRPIKSDAAREKQGEQQ